MIPFTFFLISFLRGIGDGRKIEIGEIELREIKRRWIGGLGSEEDKKKGR